MISLEDICEKLECHVIHKNEEFSNKIIDKVAVSDLMSEVLVIDEEDLVLVTALPSDQVVRTADIVGAVGIILVNSKQPQKNMEVLAKELDINLLTTSHTCFNTCIAVGKLLGL